MSTSENAAQSAAKIFCPAGHVVVKDGKIIYPHSQCKEELTVENVIVQLLKSGNLSLDNILKKFADFSLSVKLFKHYQKLLLKIPKNLGLSDLCFFPDGKIIYNAQRRQKIYRVTVNLLNEK